MKYLALLVFLVTVSVAHAATLNPNDNARRLLLGTPRTVDQVEAHTNTWGSAHAHDFTTYQIEATFGRYGTLPIVVVSVTPEQAGTAGFFLLVDGVNGMVDGPFAGGTVPAPGMLLSGHTEAYLSGTEYKAVDAGGGCPTPPVAVWHPAPPPGTTVTAPPPALPTYIPRPATPTAPAGWPTVPKCVTIGVPATCRCSYQETLYNCPGCAAIPPATPPALPAPGVIRHEVNWNCPASTCTNAVPNSPGVVPGGTGGCTPAPDRYWY